MTLQPNEKISPITGIKRTKVTSSNIAEVGHDERTGTIEVKFNNGAVWQYPGPFDRDTFESFCKADKLDQYGSVGKFFNKHIRTRNHAQKHICVTQNEAEA